MYSSSHYINERSSVIPIKKNLSTQMNVNSPKGEYSLKQNFFDPSKSSPPNDFMLKLHMRISNYDSKNYILTDDTKDDSRDTKDDNRDNE
jgi:hypothetical protein